VVFAGTVSRQDDAGRGNLRGILHRDRVAQHVARIDDTWRTEIAEQRNRFSA
jgi:hypothetical protein